MSNTLQEIGIIAQKMKIKDGFPDHICAQSNRVMCHASMIPYLADGIKYEKSNDVDILIISLKNTAASCLIMISELQKLK